MPYMHKKRIGLIILFVCIIGLLYYLGVGRFFSLNNIGKLTTYLKTVSEKNYGAAVLTFIGIYTALIMFVLPTVAPLSMAGGFLFGVIPGFGYSLISCTIGSLINFLFIRYVFGAAMRKHYERRLYRFNEKIKLYGPNYLITLHLLTVIPFFIINTMAALTNISLLTFIVTTILGCTPIVFIYSLAGRQLGAIESVRDIFSPQVIIILIVLILIAVIPIFLKKLKQSVEI